MAEKIIYAISDSLGETAEAVARATASQYDKEQIEIVRIPYIDSESQIDEIVDDAKRGHHVIVILSCLSLCANIFMRR